ncbi:MAG: hypothetical protein IH596_11875, partial [Bacteroidales bacterium]|nr:hypothetical protein [Bacteroidales bacterium]
MKTKIYALAFILFTFGSLFSTAAEFNVSSPVDFQSALTTAANNGEADVINVNDGIYNLTSTLMFYSEEDYTLSIIGEGAEFTILDGSDSRKLLIIETTMPNADVLVSNLSFMNGLGTNGAVSMNFETATLNITNCVFESNTATDFGGGLTVYSISGEVYIDGCYFENNKATGNDAGGLFVGTDHGLISLSNSTFINNEAQGDDAGGSMLYSDAGGTAIMFGNTYRNNLAFEDAGGAMVYLLGTGAAADIHNNLFDDNHSGLGGGGLWMRLPGGGEVNYHNNIHIGNTTQIGAGAGLLLELQIEGDLYMSENRFEQNEAGLADSDVGDGGGCWIEHGAGVLSIWDNDFFDNSAYNNGGGISVYTESGDMDFYRNRISGNQAGNVGGGLSYATTSGIPYDYHNSFYGNSAGATGGAIYFYMDQAPSVLYLWNSIYWNNQPNQFEYDGPNAIMAMY